MILRRLKAINKNQRGVTLIELLLAITITGILTGSITMSVFQVFDVNTRNSNHMIAVRQVQSAGYWVSHDAQMAQIVMLDDPETAGVTEFLTLTWTEYVSSDEHRVVYTMVGDKFQREHYTNYDPVTNPDPDSTIFVADYVDPDPTKTKCELIDTNGDGVDDKLILTVTATVSTGSQVQSETWTYEVTPRPD